MSDIRAKNIGAVVNNPTAPVTVTNYIGSEPSRPLPSTIPSAKGFVGREAELNVLREAWHQGKTAFVLHGQGGVGKTELALEFIEETKVNFEANIKVDMRGLEINALSPKEAMLEIVRAFEPNLSADLSDQKVKSLYVQLLNQHNIVIFLDNAKNRTQVETLNDPKALIFITSRTAFNVSGGFSKEVDQMSPEDARILLYSVAGEARFNGQADAFAHLAGYLPMALLPLASILAEDVTLQASEVLQKYKDRKERLQLADPNRGSLSIAASFDLTYEHLTEELRELWRKLAVFPADFGLKAMQAIWAIENVEEVRSELTRNHLMLFDAESKRSRLHDLARDYAREKLSKAELNLAQLLHAFYFGQVLATLDKVTLENLELFDLERANIEVGFSWSRRHIEMDDRLAILCTLYTGYASDLLFLRLPIDTILDWQEVGLLAYTKLGNPKGQAYSINNIGRAHSSKGELREAIDYYKKALEIVARIGESQFEGNWLGNLGNVYTKTENYDEAIRCHQKAIEVSQRMFDHESEARHFANLGGVYFKLGDLDKAVHHLKKALSFDHIAIDMRGNALATLGNICLLKGEDAKAKSLMIEALPILDAIRSPNAERVRAMLETQR